MPSLLNASVHRRAFLKSAFAGAAVLALKPSAFAAEKEFHVALISDTHIPADANDIYRGFKPVENLKRIVPELVEAKPELTLHCGDAARLEGKIEDYQQIATLLQPVQAAGPLCMTLGNHDDRANFNTVFKAVAGQKQNVNGKNTLVIEHEIARFVVLDSLMYVNKAAGQVGKAQRAWLGKYLGTVTDRPVVIFVHHTLADADGDLVDVDRLFEVIKPHPHVKAIFYGHSHVWAISQRQNVQLINLPAVGYNFADKEPVGWVDARFRPNGVQLTLHAFAGNTAENGKQFDVKWA
jgi:3',5'-cyclic-AMP phosphodiesterase